MLPHPVTNFEIRIYYQNQPKFNSVYSKSCLSNSKLRNDPIIKDGLHIINIDEYKSIRTHWTTLCVNSNSVTYFDSFEVAQIPKDTKKFIGNKNVITNTCVWIFKCECNVWIFLCKIY